MNCKSQVDAILKALQNGTKEVRESPSESAYLKAERAIENAGNQGFSWKGKMFLLFSISLFTVICIVWINSFKKSPNVQEAIPLSQSTPISTPSPIQTSTFVQTPISTPAPKPSSVKISEIQNLSSDSESRPLKFPTHAELIGETNSSQINVRSSPSVESVSPHYGLVGDTVVALQESKDNDGFTWYFVEFPSKAKGWVRGDFVSLR